MFSIHNFYAILYENLFKHADFCVHYYFPFGSTNLENLVTYPIFTNEWNNHLLAYDQEPIIKDLPTLPINYNVLTPCKILSNSEHSLYKTQQCKKHNWQDFYYFFHGFAALYWMNDWKYLSKVERPITHPFINFNRLVTNDRSYRLLLVSKMIEKNLTTKGLISLSLIDHGYGSWRDEMFNHYSYLSQKQKNYIECQLGKNNYQSLIIDQPNPEGYLSAQCDIENFNLNQKALWHVVSETVFYHDKLHLTEKIFKPIACRRPFILVAAPGNLAYLKSYGFKTFDKWIDESYDEEKDFDKRLEKIVNEIEKISALDHNELKQMHLEMNDILEFNFNHFYGNFKSIIVHELLQNFRTVIENWNNQLDNKNFIVRLDRINFDAVYKELMK